MAQHNKMSSVHVLKDPMQVQGRIFRPKIRTETIKLKGAMCHISGLAGISVTIRARRH